MCLQNIPAVTNLLEPNEYVSAASKQIASGETLRYTIKTLSSGKDGLKVVSLPYPSGLKPPIAKPDVNKEGREWRVFVYMSPEYTTDTPSAFEYNSVKIAFALADDAGQIYGSTYAVPLSKGAKDFNGPENIGAPKATVGDLLVLPDGSSISIHGYSGTEAASISYNPSKKL